MKVHRNLYALKLRSPWPVLSSFVPSIFIGKRPRIAGFSAIRIVTLQIAAIFVGILSIQPAEAAPSPELVKDIWTANSSNGSNPENLTALGNTVFFSATDITHGVELWKSDGTAEGTVLVKDIYPGTTGSNNGLLYDFTVVGGTLFFAADDGTHGWQLWKSDGTETGTVLVKEIYSESGSSQPDELTAVGGTLFFRAFESTTHGFELWKSDGTEEGTVLVKDILGGVGSGVPKHLTNVDGTLYFNAFISPGVRGLWKSDGTAEGTVLVKNVPDPESLTAVGSTLYFTIRGQNGLPTLWKSDGTAVGTVLVTDINIDPDSLTVVGNTLYFSGSDLGHGNEVWKSDSSAGGAVLVRDISPGTDSSNPASLTAMGGTLYFKASDLVNGSELWKSDGTEAGTVLVKDIREGPFGSGPDKLTAVGDTLYFGASEPVTGRGLWKSNGTAAGTVLVKDLNPDGAASELNHLIAVGNTLFFVPNQPATGKELWKSDGTIAGTVLIKDIVKTSSSDPSELTALGNTLYLAANDSMNGVGVWKSDGTQAGTVLVKENVKLEGQAHPVLLATVGGTLWFLVDGAGLELWKTDGTAEGTTLLQEDIPEWGEITVVGETLFFSRDDGANGEELWKSDGTGIGILVKDINAGTDSSNPSYLTAVGDTLYFMATDPVNGFELRKSDGTEAGTVLVKDLTPGPDDTSIENPAAVGGLFYFSIRRDFSIGWELWKSDGTEAGTILVKEITPGTPGTSIRGLSHFTAVGSTLYFSAYEADNPTGGRHVLWKSDGTVAGTVSVKEIATRVPTNHPLFRAAMGDTLYFVADDPAFGLELWKTVGTAAGTVLVKDINAGIRGSDPENLTAMGGELYFGAYHPTHGHELWKSDGTAAGTALVKDVTRDSGSSLPKNLRVVGSKLYFSAQTEQAGRELYVYDPNGNAEPTVTLTGLSSTTIEASAAGYTDPGATATDVVDGSLSPVMTANNVNASVPGAYQVTWTATDKGGLAGVAMRAVNVQDTTPPIVGGKFSPRRIVTGTSLPDYTGQAVVSDFVGVTSVTQSPLPGTPTAIGKVEVTITAKDAANNEASVTFSVRVKEPGLVRTLLHAKNGPVPNAGTDPRIESGAAWTTLGVPAISDSGAVAFLGKWSTAPQSGAGLFVDDTLLVKVGEAVPGAGSNGLPTDAVFKSFRDPVLDGEGRVSFLAVISGNGVRSGNDTMVMSNGRGGALEVLAREGDLAPGAPGAKFKSFSDVSAKGNGATLFTAKLQPGTGEPRVNATTDCGVWWRPMGKTTVTLLVREGDPGFQAGEKIKSIAVLQPLSGSPGHGRGFINDHEAWLSLSLVGGSKPRKVQALASLETLTERVGTEYLLGGSILPEAVWRSINPASCDDTGTYLAAMGTLQHGVGTITNTNAKGIFLSASSGTSWKPLVRTGDPLPGIEAVFSGFKDPVNASTDSGVAFLVTIKGPRVRGNNNDALLWQREGDEITLVAREGDKLSSATPDAKWASFTSVALPGGGVGPLFTATLQRGSGGITSANDTGLYAIDSEGALHELLRENQPLENKTVKMFTALKAGLGAIGSTRSFNVNHEVVAQVTFTDGSIGIVMLDVP